MHANLGDPDQNPDHNPGHPYNLTVCSLARDRPLVKRLCKYVCFFLRNQTEEAGRQTTNQLDQKQNLPDGSNKSRITTTCFRVMV